MSYLIDTHIFIWLMENSKKVSPRIKTLLSSPSINVFISIVSIWEIVIKQTKGQLKTPKNIEESIHKAGFKILPIEISHVLGLKELPLHHKDPYDRMLISQAQAESLTLITSDVKIWKYEQVSTGSHKKLSLIKA